MKKISTLFLLLMLSSMTVAQVSIWDGTHKPWTHGTGTEEDPFLIENAQQLANLTYRVNNGLDAAGGHVSNHDYHYKLMIDIDLNGSEAFQWTPIGYWNSETDYQCFGGHFDGNGHTISGLYINSSTNRVGLFGNTDSATIQNLSVNGNMIATTGPYAGGIIAYASGTTNIVNCNCTHSGDIRAVSVGGIIGNSSGPLCIESCYHDGFIAYSSSGNYAGGIVGAMFNGTIVNCYNMGSFDGNISCYVRGGIAGYVGNTTGETTVLTNCFNTGNIMNNSGSHDYAGGIVGQNNGNLSITNCYNMGFVSGDHNTGGIIGIIGYNINYSTDVSNSYNAGDLFNYSNDNPGGIVGYGNNNNSNCYYLNTCGGNNTCGGQPMSADAMQSAEFVSIINDGVITFKQDRPPYVNQGYPVFTDFVLETLPATSVGYYSATLNGNYPTGIYNITSQGFEYKKTTEQDYTTVICADTPTPYSYMLTGLECGTDYQYRAFVIADEGSAYGELLEFTTPIPSSYTITASSSTGGNINPTGNVTVYEGSSKTFTITPASNYVVIQSVLVDGESVGTPSSYTFENVTANHTITVSFRSLIHLITATASEGGSISPSGTVSIHEGENKTFTITPASNYVIQSVLVDGESVGTPSSYTFENVNESHTISVSFRSLIHHITATVSDHGTISPSGIVSVQEGQNKTFTITPDPGFEINALIVDNDTVENALTYTFNNVTEDHTIAASFVETTGPCLPPLNLIVNEVNATSVRLSWQGGADVYVIAYGVDGNYSHAASTSDNSIRIEGLIHQSDYVWKIKSVCGDMETDYVEGQPFTTSGQGVNENDNIVFGMWPNPAHETVVIMGDNIEKIEAFNVLGQKVLSVYEHEATTIINVSGLNSGLYIVRVTNSTGNVGLGKLMVE